MTATPTILIVDDQPNGQEVLAGLLHNQGYRLLFAASGPEALAVAAEANPDLILLDVMMYGMDGFEVCQHLRANPQLAEVPVFLITALDDRESRLHGIAVGADDFVTKPFDRAELRLRVQTVTRLNRYRRLLDERSRLSWVVEHSGDGYLLIDCHDMICYTNPQARLYLGIDDELQAQKHSFRQIAASTYRCEPQTAWANWPALDQQAPPVRRYLVRPESPTAHALWLLVELIDQGDAETRLVRLHNITTQIDLYQGTWSFHTGILHKLRTPLSSIMMSMDLIKRRLEHNYDEVAMQMLEVALRGSQRLNDQINEILTYIQVSKTGIVGGRFACAALPALVAEIEELLDLPPITVGFSPEATDLVALLSRRTFELILIELLGNAKKFHPEQQPHIEVTITPMGHAVLIRVGDNGVTLSPEQLTRAWVPYYQGEKHFTGEIPGMGLGLTMVATQLWSVGGSCRIANQEHKQGVVVSLVVPCTQQ